MEKVNELFGDIVNVTPNTKVFVQVGQKVKKNDAHLVIEAIKMENTITANHDASVSSIVLKKDR